MNIKKKMKKKDRGYITPNEFSKMIYSFLENDFSEFHPEIFADTLMMPTQNVELNIIKKYLSMVAWRYQVDDIVGWNTEQGRAVLQALARRMSNDENYDFIFDIISDGLGPVSK